MILLFVGLPGRLIQWCDGVMTHLAGHLGGQVASGTFPALSEMFRYEAVGPIFDDVARFLIRNVARHVVIGARQPDQGLCRIFAERQVRFVLALDDPGSAVASIIAETGAEPKTAVRAVAKSCPLVMQFDGLPGALAIGADFARSDPAGAVAAIAAHFGIAVYPGEVSAIADAVGPLGPDPCSPGGGPLAGPLPAATRRMIDGALSGYRERFRNGRLDRIVWTRDLFHLGCDAGRSPTEPVDVSGGRVLVYGPYIHLPAGSWSAQVVLGFSREAATATFLVDIYADGQLACTTFVPGAAGVHVANLAFSSGEPSGNGVEVRVMVSSEAAAGRLAFGQVVLQPLSVAKPEASGDAENFESVLDL